jgi:hypothetical protein
MEDKLSKVVEVFVGRIKKMENDYLRYEQPIQYTIGTDPTPDQTLLSIYLWTPLRYVHFLKIKHLLLEYLYMQRICKK